jgi:hypothetical protein
MLVDSRKIDLYRHQAKWKTHAERATGKLFEPR